MPTTFHSFLQNVSSDLWSQHMMPLLIEQGSARQVTLSCSALRDLCCNGVQTLDTVFMCEQQDPQTYQQWIQRAAQHFPDCETVKFCVEDSRWGSMVGHMVPALARLRNLDTLNCMVGASQSAAEGLITMLSRVRTGLSSLRRLELLTHQGLAGVNRAWYRLGRFTHITALDLFFMDLAEEPAPVLVEPARKDLAALSNLVQLESLSIIGDMFERRLPCFQFLGRLTSLISLHIAPGTLDDVVSSPGLGRCIKLQQLVLDNSCLGAQQLEIGPAHWDSIARLTLLTCLELANHLALSASPECKSTLQELRNLQSISTGMWSLDMLPVLAECSRLTEIGGGWCQAAAAASTAVGNGVAPPAAVVMPSVVVLEEVHGAVPFAAFPALQTVVHVGSITCSAFAVMARHCHSIQEFELEPPDENAPLLDPAFTSLPPFEPRQDRIDCIKSLAALTNLTQLSFSPHDSVEAAALAVSAAQLVSCQLRSLRLVLTTSTEATISGLGLLARLRGLRTLHMELLHPSLVLCADDAIMLLSYVSGVMDVSIACPSALPGELQLQVQRQLLQDAVLADCGLPKPAAVKMTYPTAR